jgi:hypothetical protein
MNHYVGIDVSLEASSVCVVDTNGRIAREGKVASEPDALIAWPYGRCARPDLPSSFWRHGTCAPHSRRCR